MSGKRECNIVTMHEQSLTGGGGVVTREPRIVAFECHYGIVGQVEDMKLTISTIRALS
jgi:hypothetical protein